MSKYQMQDGTVINTDRSSESWSENSDWNGSNNVSCATKSQFEHETLYRSRKGRYYKVCWSQWQGNLPYAEWLDERAACRWLLVNNKDIPEDLKELVDEVEE